MQSSRLSQFQTASLQPQRVYCPVCCAEYSSEQAEAHIQKHLSPAKLSLSAAHSLSAKLSQNPTASTQGAPHATVYPMVEPLEFWTHELTQVALRDSYHIDHQEVNRKPQERVVTADAETQTLNRPRLQEASEETDLYNCLDGVFNSGSFSRAEVVERNVGLASKRGLNEWERANFRK